MTDEKVTDRVKREFRYFQLDMLRTSRENIFAHGEEICVKTQAAREACQLCAAGKMPPDVPGMLEAVPNLLEAAYGFYKDEQSDGQDPPVQGIFPRYLSAVVEAGE